MALGAAATATQDLTALLHLREAMETILDAEKRDYLTACLLVPELVDTESNPLWFLRREGFDAFAERRPSAAQDSQVGTELQAFPILFTMVSGDKNDVVRKPDDRNTHEPAKRGPREMFGFFGQRRVPPPRATDGKTTGGVFVSTRSWPTMTEHSVAAEKDSTSWLESSEPARWKSSGSKTHNLNCPMVVSDPENPNEIIDEEVALSKIKERAQRLPTEWCYSCNHVMVNQERTKEMIAPLGRLTELDVIARLHAEAMAEKDRHLI